MQYYLEVPLSSGDTVLAEITDQVDDVVPSARGKAVIGRLSGSFSEGLDHVRAFAAEVLNHMKQTQEPPDRIAVEFALVLSATAGVAIAQMAGEGHAKVIVEWVRPTQLPPGSRVDPIATAQPDSDA